MGDPRKCLGSEDCTCDSCQNAALTGEDREWLESHGWKDPFLTRRARGLFMLPLDLPPHAE